MREQHGEAARAGAHVDDALHRAAMRQPLRDLLGQQFEEIRPRNNDALVDEEAVFAEERLARQVGGGHATHRAPAENLRQPSVFNRRQLAAQHVRSAVKR